MAFPFLSPGDSRLHPCFVAVFSGDLPSLKSMAEEFQRVGLDIESIADDDDHNALHYAAAIGRTRICEYLVGELKLNIDAKDIDDLTPLHTAILRGNFPTAIYLAENGADTNAGTCLHRTSLHYAVRNGPEKLLKLLIRKGGDVNAVADIGTPLVDAALQGKKNVVKILLNNNADPNAISYYSTSPLLASIESRSVECVKLLLEAGADPNIFGSNGHIPIILAASRKDAGIIKFLLDSGADPNVTNHAGMTALEVAASISFHEGVKLLFPVTSPITAVRDWRILELMKHVSSPQAKKEWKQKSEENTQLSKSKGVEAFNKKDYYGAIKWYTQAYHSSKDGKMLSNRSLCWANLKMGGIALHEAEACINVMPEWPKAYYRKGAAMMILNDYKRAVDAFSEGLKLAPDNEELQHVLREAKKGITS